MLTEAVKSLTKKQIDPNGIFANMKLVRNEIETVSAAKIGIKKYKSDKVVQDSLFEVINYLAHGQSLDPKFNDHKLTGPLKGYRDCHLKGSQVLLVYRVSGNRIIFFYVGDHKGLSAIGKQKRKP